MKEFPVVSVLIATYNYEKFIGNAIESILSQTYPLEKIQIVIVDDGSVDQTGCIVNNYKSKADISYIFQENKGKAAATSLGLNLLKGKYTFILDADDWYLPNCIETVTTYFEENPKVVQVSHLANRYNEITRESIPQSVNHKYINKAFEGKFIFEKSVFEEVNIGMGSTFAIKTKTLKSFKIPDEVDMYIDYYLFLAASACGQIIQLDKNLSVFRRHSRSYSEGKDKFEANQTRLLRYLKSAKALCDEGQSKIYGNKINLYFKLFYYQHLLITAKFIGERKLKVALKLVTLTIFTMYNYKSSSKFFIRNLKGILNAYVKK